MFIFTKIVGQIWPLWGQTEWGKSEGDERFWRTDVSESI